MRRFNWFGLFKKPKYQRFANEAWHRELEKAKKIDDEVFNKGDTIVRKPSK